MLDRKESEFVPQDLAHLKIMDADPGRYVANFHVGERFTLNGVIFALRKITRKDIVARPVRGSKAATPDAAAAPHAVAEPRTPNPEP